MMKTRFELDTIHLFGKQKYNHADDKDETRTINLASYGITPASKATLLHSLQSQCHQGEDRLCSPHRVHHLGRRQGIHENHASHSLKKKHEPSTTT